MTHLSFFIPNDNDDDLKGNFNVHLWGIKIAIVAYPHLINNGTSNGIIIHHPPGHYTGISLE